ncbi:tRNA epoxyqueuosine(34) reductase QueG [Ilyomonas limi]|uniref:Epoxyqueuosine reductase n=1 Tax=Ilyomonas limi TaxID=2575867 RepID=A0A4U3L9H2_9BACT|nr:tRNA epoxyqueuosine(34) reductase QueG [Ilyomonas limi]
MLNKAHGTTISRDLRLITVTLQKNFNITRLQLNSRIVYSNFIKKTAQELNFSLCGIAKAEELTEDARRLEQWLSQGRHGNMQYMERYFDMRINPSLLVPGAQSVITLLCNYFPAEKQQPHAPRISKYAYGKDYHEVIKAKLNEFLYRIQEEIGAVHGRGFIDSAPVLERAWATKSGLGWIGKNGNFITKQQGSFFFIATLIVDLALQPDDPFARDYCGSCSRCIDACPTGAILPNKEVQGNKCISYYTIELKDMLLPAEMRDKFQDWMFGCDVCQDVCPWNRFSKPHNEVAFTPIPEILNLSTREWQALSEESFRQIFKHSPLKRSKYKGIQRNVKFIAGEE